MSCSEGEEEWGWMKSVLDCSTGSSGISRGTEAGAKGGHQMGLMPPGNRAALVAQLYFVITWELHMGYGSYTSGSL